MEETEVDRLPARLGDALGLDLRGSRGGLFGTEMIVPASAAFFTGALFSIPRAGASMRGEDALGGRRLVRRCRRGASRVSTLPRVQ